MKILSLSFLVIIMGHCLFAQELNVPVFINEYNLEISLYTDPISNTKLCGIYQDSVFQHYYEVIIKEESVLRYRVVLFSVSQYNSPEIEGWIDKKYCSVLLFPIMQRGINKLHTIPSESSPYIELKNSYTVSATVVSVSKSNNKFLKIMVFYEDKYYEGWINKYCYTIYNSCN